MAWLVGMPPLRRFVTSARRERHHSCYFVRFERAEGNSASTVRTTEIDESMICFHIPKVSGLPVTVSISTSITLAQSDQSHP